MRQSKILILNGCHQGTCRRGCRCMDFGLTTTERAGGWVDHRNHSVLHRTASFSITHRPHVLSQACDDGIEHKVRVNAGPRPTCPCLGAHRTDRVSQAEIQGGNERRRRLHHRHRDGVVIDAAIAVHHGPNPFKVTKFRSVEDPNAVDPRLLRLNAVALRPLRQSTRSSRHRPTTCPRRGCIPTQRAPKFKFHDVGGGTETQVVSPPARALGPPKSTSSKTMPD